MTYATIARHSGPSLRGDGLALLLVPPAMGFAVFVALSAVLLQKSPPARPAAQFVADPAWAGGLGPPSGIAEATPATSVEGARAVRDAASLRSGFVSAATAGLIAHAAALASRIRSPGAPPAAVPATTGLIAHAAALAARIRSLDPDAPAAPAAADSAKVAETGTAQPTVRPPAEVAANVPMPPPLSANPWLPRAAVSVDDASARTAPFDASTAVYEIASHTVYLPDGTRLEAHSGLGSRLDDPRSVKERMRGATPPNVYEIQPLDKLFHGVRALRLNPVGDGNMYGRDGMLAHTYMLGPRGESNGCVVFKNYAAFLGAWDRGAIKRLAVVARLN